MRNLHMCKKRTLKLGECSDCSELESIVEQLQECCTDSQDRLDHIEDILDNLESVSFELVDELPETGESNVIYLVPKEEPGQSDAKDEYIWVDNSWELIGSTDIDTYRDMLTQQHTTMI